MGLAKDFVVFLGCDVTIMQSGNDCVRERKLFFTVNVDGYIVAQDGAETVEVACFMPRANPPPVAPKTGFGSEGRGRSAIRVSWFIRPIKGLAAIILLSG